MSVARQVLCRLCAGVRSPGVVTSRALASTPSLGDKVTHTGQQWDEADPRNARFSVTGLEKQVNNQWAIDLIAKVPPKEVNTRIVSLPPRVPSFKTLNTIYSVKKNFIVLCQVACDGGGGALGHPKVYINLDDGTPKGCIYCGLRFVFKPDH